MSPFSLLSPSLVLSPILHQHVHFHSTSPAVPVRRYGLTDHLPSAVIPKPSAADDAGLVVGWPTKPADMAELKAYLEEIKEKL